MPARIRGVLNSPSGLGLPQVIAEPASIAIARFGLYGLEQDMCNPHRHLQYEAQIGHLALRTLSLVFAGAWAPCPHG
jgi:hypothetical protein